jgi:hypothetical protein
MGAGLSSHQPENSLRVQAVSFQTRAPIKQAFLSSNPGFPCCKEGIMPMRPEVSKGYRQGLLPLKHRSSPPPLLYALCCCRKNRKFRDKLISKSGSVPSINARPWYPTPSKRLVPNLGPLPTPRLQELRFPRPSNAQWRHAC